MFGGTTRSQVLELLKGMLAKSEEGKHAEAPSAIMMYSTIIKSSCSGGSAWRFLTLVGTAIELIVPPCLSPR